MLVVNVLVLPVSNTPSPDWLTSKTPSSPSNLTLLPLTVPREPDIIISGWAEFIINPPSSPAPEPVVTKLNVSDCKSITPLLNCI